MLKLPHKEPLNLVPFIDIMLVLLCIVLSISTFIAHSKIDINLPESSTKQRAESKKIVLSVNRENQYFLDSKAIELDSLKEYLSKLKVQDHVQLFIDKKASFDQFIIIIDILKRNNHENFSIATEYKK